MPEKKGPEELERDNRRLCEALREISAKYDEIKAILDSVSDLIVVRETVHHEPVSDEDVKNLLKKYSRLS